MWKVHKNLKIARFACDQRPKLPIFAKRPIHKTRANLQPDETYNYFFLPYRSVTAARNFPQSKNQNGSNKPENMAGKTHGYNTANIILVSRTFCPKFGIRNSDSKRVEKFARRLSRDDLTRRSPSANWARVACHYRGFFVKLALHHLYVSFEFQMWGFSIKYHIR